MAKATVENIYWATPRTKDWKTTYAFSVLLSDWEKGNTNLFDTNDAIKIWQEIEYEIQENNWFRNIVIKKPKKPWSWGWSQKDYKKEAIISSMECSVNILKHRWTKDVETLIEPLANKILKRYTEQWL